MPGIFLPNRKVIDLKYYAASDVGVVRKENEDYIYASCEPVGTLPNLFIVADGMGGHNAGEIASRFAVSEAVRYIASSNEKDIKKLFTKAVDAANIRVYNTAHEKPEYYGMGTTMVLASIIDGTLCAANVGDSRLYVCDNDLRQISEDHSLVEELVKNGLLSRDSEEYNKKKNVITRAVGTSYSIEADYFEVNLCCGCRVLLCSDGLSNMIGDGDIFEIIKSNPKTEDSVKSLMITGKKNGGRDNISLIVIDPEI